MNLKQVRNNNLSVFQFNNNNYFLEKDAYSISLIIIALIQSGTSKINCETSWQSSFVCKNISNYICLSPTKLHLEFVKCEEKRFWHAIITWPNFVTAWRLKLKALNVTFESNAKSTLSNYMSANHCSALNSPRDSRTST